MMTMTCWTTGCGTILLGTDTTSPGDRHGGSPHGIGALTILSGTVPLS